CAQAAPHVETAPVAAMPFIIARREIFISVITLSLLSQKTMDAPRLPGQYVRMLYLEYSRRQPTTAIIRRGEGRMLTQSPAFPCGPVAAGRRWETRGTFAVPAPFLMTEGDVISGHSLRSRGGGRAEPLTYRSKSLW